MATRAYYLKNRDRLIAAAKARYWAKKEEIQAYKREWQRKNKDRLRARNKAKYQRDRDAISLAAKAKYAADPTAWKARAKLYRQRHPEKATAAVTAWCQANKARLRVVKVKWQRADYRRHPEKYREIQSRRKALKLRTATEKIDFKKILQEANGRCGICRQPFDLFGIHFDHKIPLSRGGTHTFDNLQATHARCNLAKGARVAI